MKLKKYITKDEIDNFMTEKARQIEEVENWTESSRKRMKNKIVECKIWIVLIIYLHHEPHQINFHYFFYFL